MACVQKTKPSQSQLLPNEVVSEAQSIIVVKKLLAIAVSGITYLRGVFPGKAYGTKFVEDQQVMILKGDRDCLGSMQILDWMQGCFDAIQRKYLRTVIISIYTDPANPMKVTEFYQLRIQYSSFGASMDFESHDNQKISTAAYGNTKKACILLVRKLYTLMQNLGPLPENVFLNMKLAYYDDVTPMDYQPPGFKDAVGGMMSFEHEPVKLTMGEVSTPFHSITFDMTTEKQRLEQEEAVVSPQTLWLLNMDEDGVIRQKRDAVEQEVPPNYSQPKQTVGQSFQMSCEKTVETYDEISGTFTPGIKSNDLKANLKRARSRRFIGSAAEGGAAEVDDEITDLNEIGVSHYSIQSSQESLTNFAPNKKRKFSEPKDLF